MQATVHRINPLMLYGLIALTLLVTAGVGWLAAGYWAAASIPGVSDDKFIPGEPRRVWLKDKSLFVVESNWRGKIESVDTVPVVLAGGEDYEWKFNSVTSRDASWSNSYSVLEPGAADLVSVFFTVEVPDDPKLYDRELEAAVQLTLTWSHAPAFAVLANVSNRSERVTERFTFTTINSKAALLERTERRNLLLMGVLAGLLILGSAWAFGLKDLWYKPQSTEWREN